jgi:phosphoribosylpyrophosphate synthetase
LDRIFLWSWQDGNISPGDRLLQLAFAAQFAKKKFHLLPRVIFNYGDFSRINGGAIVGAYASTLLSIPAEKYLFFDLHRSDFLNYFSGMAHSHSTLSTFAEAIDGFSPKIDSILSPDLGRGAAVKAMADQLSIGHCCMDKRKFPPLPGKISETLRGKNVVLFDDEIVSGKTLRDAISFLGKCGVGSIKVCIIYALCDRKIFFELMSAGPVAEIFCSNLIPKESPLPGKEIDAIGPALGEILGHPPDRHFRNGQTGHSRGTKSGVR